jgi:hypothetical protein
LACELTPFLHMCCILEHIVFSQEIQEKLRAFVHVGIGPKLWMMEDAINFRLLACRRCWICKGHISFILCRIGASYTRKLHGSKRCTTFIWSARTFEALKGVGRPAQVIGWPALPVSGSGRAPFWPPHPTPDVRRHANPTKPTIHQKLPP